MRPFVEKPEQMRPNERLDFRWRIIRKGTLTKYIMIMWTGVSGSRQDSVSRFCERGYELQVPQEPRNFLSD